VLTSRSGHKGNAAALRRTQGDESVVTNTGSSSEQPTAAADNDQKRVALGYLHEAWAEARLDGIDGDCLAQACLFAALAEFVSTYGEDAAATFAEGLSERIRNGEFSLVLPRQ
jgi:hypothetical protein